MAELRKKNEDALLVALACGATVESASRQCGLSERTVYRRLRTHADNGNAVQLGDGRWRCP